MADKHENALLQQFLDELAQEIETETGKISKGKALMSHIVDEALKGEQKMFAHALKLIERLPDREGKASVDDLPDSREDWLGFFIFAAQYKTLIEQEIERLKTQNPDFWNFEWFRPTLETAPWYEALHGEA